MKVLLSQSLMDSNWTSKKLPGGIKFPEGEMLCVMRVPSNTNYAVAAAGDEVESDEVPERGVPRNWRRNFRANPK